MKGRITGEEVLSDFMTAMQRVIAQRINIRTLFCTLLFAAGCTQHHHVTPAEELHTQLAPFTQTRDQAVALVTGSKRSFDAPSINQLAVSYADLEAKGNAYAGFLVESASISSFDAARNESYSTNLGRAIDAFNKSFATINPQVNPPTISKAWIPMFAGSVKGYWDRYHTNLAAEPADKKTALIQELKTDTVWPNFEEIATEHISPSPH